LTPARKNQARIPPAGVNAPGYNGSAHRAGALREKTLFGQVEAIDLNRPQAVQ